MGTIFENDYDLPGVYTEVLPDYSYGYDTSLFGTTDPVLIIGTAFNGPSGEVMEVYSKEHGSYIFGKAYDNEKQLESNLVAGIHDAWDRGCRTIYACRVGGKDLYKDFNLRVDSKFKFRVMSMFPSNIEKECYIRYDNTSGAETITIYKPAERATIAQKRQGLVEGDNTVLVTTLQINQDYGFTKDSPLVDVINMFNAHTDNNVIKLGLVNSEGKDVTNSIEARSLSLGALYQGIYFIGREYSACAEETEVKFDLVKTEIVNGIEVSNKPYKNFKGNYFHTLVENTDIQQPFPIFADKNTLREILKDVSITVNTKKPWEWLEVAELSDRAFVPDEKDYEEVNLSGFDLYRRLGMGFATTAMAERRVVPSTGEVITPRVKETPIDNPNHIVPLQDGLYSMLQDATMKYRVLMCTSAEASTKGKLPRAKDFIQTTPVTLTVLNGTIELIPNVNADDRTDARSYNVKFQNVPETAVADINDAYINQVFEVVSILPATESDGSLFNLEKHNVPQGSKFLEDNGDGSYSLVRVTSTVDRLVNGESLNGKYIIAVDGATNSYNLYKGEHKTAGDPDSDIVFRVMTDLSVFMNSDGSDQAKFLLGSLVDNIFVFQINGSQLEPNGDFNGMITDDQTAPVIYAEDLLFQPNDVIFNSAILCDTTFEELVDLLNEHEVFGKIFTASLTDTGASYKDEKILDIIAPNADPSTFFVVGDGVLSEDRVTDYNYNLYIPYKTTDNFARQFAQHCTYTELKTAPTWGFIGTARVGSTDLTGVSEAVDKFLTYDFSLYAKNNAGRNMLDRDNMPYPIGRNLSIIFAQYPEYIETEDYMYTSNGAAGYAGMVSALPLDQSSTNQPFSVNSIGFNLTQYQHSKLNNKGVVTLKRSYTRGIVVLDGTTMAPVDSVFRRLSASRIVGAVEELIRAVAEPYIGKQNHDANRNSLHTAIKGQLDELVGTLLEDYQFNMITDPRAERFNYIDIDYELVPIYEIRQVRNRISVKETLTK